MITIIWCYILPETDDDCQSPVGKIQQAPRSNGFSQQILFWIGGWFQFFLKGFPPSQLVQGFVTIHSMKTQDELAGKVWWSPYVWWKRHTWGFRQQKRWVRWGYHWINLDQVICLSENGIVPIGRDYCHTFPRRWLLDEGWSVNPQFFCPWDICPVPNTGGWKMRFLSIGVACVI